MGTLVTKQTEHDEYENTHKYTNKVTYDGWLGNLTNQPTNETSILSLLFWPSQSITNVRCVNLVNDVVRLVFVVECDKNKLIEVENILKKNKPRAVSEYQNLLLWIEKNFCMIVLKTRRRVHLQCCFVKS